MKKGAGIYGGADEATGSRCGAQVRMRAEDNGKTGRVQQDVDLHAS